ncbi:hypothetical protein BKA56DRAFT_38493 [Ilyonectria sp. MPI-CAGE-AT-0026]|nr:hypothetical protein BKA56DRAFT_38493 [Ilyonectria sp. MPI-CAGE-AT-0026]
MADRVAADKGQSSRGQERGSEVGQDATSSVPGVPDSEVENRKGKDHDNKQLRRTQNTSPNSERPRTTTSNLLTCPFYVYDPVGHARCVRFSSSTMLDVRQHLKRAHMQSFHCPACGQTFASGGQRDEHITQRPCIHRDINIPGIARDQLLQIRDSQNRSRSEIENWLALWKILFPNTVPPDSSYIKTPGLRGLVQQLFDRQFKDLRTSSLPLDPAQHAEVITKDFTKYIRNAIADEGPLQRAPATSEASIGEIHPARLNTSPWDDSDDMSSNEDRYARSFIFSSGVSAFSETPHSSSGHAKPAREILADLLTNDDELRALLAAGTADTNIGIERLSKNFRTLLKMYSEELLQLADTTALKEAGKLVGNSSLYVSNRIRAQFGQPSQSSPLEDPGRLMNEEERSAKEERLNQYLKSLNAADQTDLGDALPGTGIEDTDENWHDEEAITSALEQVKSFLLNGPPFENLRQRLRSFVTPASGAGDQPIDKGMVKIQASPDGFTQMLPILIDSLFENLADLLPESPDIEGKVRARWTCVSQTLLAKLEG